MGSNQNRKKSGRPRCTTNQDDKYIRVSSLRNICLTGPQLAASVRIGEIQSHVPWLGVSCIIVLYVLVCDALVEVCYFAV